MACEPVEQDKQALDKYANNEMSYQTKCFLEFQYKLARSFQQIYMEAVVSPGMQETLGDSEFVVRYTMACSYYHS